MQPDLKRNIGPVIDIRQFEPPKHFNRISIGGKPSKSQREQCAPPIAVSCPESTPDRGYGNSPAATKALEASLIKHRAVAAAMRQYNKRVRSEIQQLRYGQQSPEQKQKADVFLQDLDGWNPDQMDFINGIRESEKLREL